ncbi:outer membrane protein [Ectothiorhodospira mobilis]|uniref:Outer membrane protein n=1 Tax=Ectothiorhodospira mobilis TaxID=195064 RepID=A0A1I4R900_ECTMO|nr:TolC family outer membrane protein [Ectothiorhodospira mobilis]SFM48788.1 outer membrane protein [Ectothiorhodospira mobilis]
MTRTPKTWLAGLSLAIVTAAPLQAADLMEVYRTALEEDPELRRAEAEYRAALEQRPQARSALLPQIRGGAGYAHTESEPDEGQEYDYQSRTFDLSLEQSLYDHANYVALRQADLGIARATATRDAARQELLLRVAEAYFGVLSAREDLDFAKAEKEAIERQLEQVQRRFDVGLIAITDVKEARAQYDLAVAEEIAAQNRLDQAEEDLSVITGRFYEELAALSDRLTLTPPDPANRDRWVETALEQNLNLAATRLATETAAEEIKRQRAGHYPTLGLSASYTDQDFKDAPAAMTGQLRDGADTQIGVQLNIPLFTGGRTSSLTREARENFDAARQQQEQVRRETVRQVRGAFLSVNSDISRVRALEQALESTRASYEAAQAGFEVGTRTAVDVLLELRRVFGAERDLADARYAYLLDTLRLKQAAGTLSEQDLAAINAWLD